MKHIFTAILLLFYLLPQLSVYTIGANLTGEPISDPVQEQFLDIIDISQTEEEVRLTSIACFGVSSTGQIALGFESFSKKTVQVYAPDGSFLYGLRFSYDGSYGLAFSGEDLSVYFAKSGYVATFTSDAECVSIASVPQTSENNEQIRALLYATEITVNDVTYQLERDIGFAARSYSRLIVTDASGTEKKLYDVTFTHNFATIIVYTALISFVVIVIVKVRNQYRSK